MGKIIAVVNQKGGVGKTTTAVNLTACLHDLGLKILLCDFDPQANATSGLGLEKRKIKNTVYDVVINEVPAASAIVRTKFGDVLPSSADLAGAGVELIGMENPNLRLKNALLSIKDQYDLIFIDCPPSLEMLTLNALAAADGILVPVQCEYYALEGLSATAARDAAILCQNGYRVVKLQAVDMFPRTAHVECVVLLSHSDANTRSVRA